MMVLYYRILEAMKNLLTSSLQVSITSSSSFGIISGQNSSSLIELKFGTGVNSDTLILNSSQKFRYKYILKEINAILRKTEIFLQALLDKSVAMATPQVTGT